MALDDPRTEPTIIDVSGLPPDAVREVESLVTRLRSAVGHPAPQPTDDEFERALRALASGPPVPTLPADWSRADLYDDHD
jgi:hypothetical protein